MSMPPNSKELAAEFTLTTNPAELVKFAGVSSKPVNWVLPPPPPPPPPVIPLRLANCVVPSPTFNILFVISYPGSPLARTGLAAAHSANVPFRNCNLVFE